MFCCRATSWDSGVCLICHAMLYIVIYVAGLICRLFTTSGLCVGSLLPGIGAVQGLFGSCRLLCFCCSVLVLEGGPTYTCGGRGVLMIFRVSSGGLLVWGHLG